MKDTAPTIEEMREIIHSFEALSFKELQTQGIFDNKRKMIVIKPMTYILMSHADDSNKEKIWRYCKKIASFSHAPIKLKDYQRMLPFSEDKDIVDVILKALEENKYPFSDGKNKVESVEGYYYAIATLSQSAYRREEIISLLQNIVNYFKNNLPDKLSVLKRNMDVLKNDYPDLGEIVFQCFV